MKDLRTKIEDIFEKQRVAYTKHDDFVVDFDINVVKTYEATDDLLKLFREKMLEIVGGDEEGSEERYKYINDWIKVRNELRSELRTKITNL